MDKFISIYRLRGLAQPHSPVNEEVALHDRMQIFLRYGGVQVELLVPKMHSQFGPDGGAGEAVLWYSEEYGLPADWYLVVQHNLGIFGGGHTAIAEADEISALMAVAFRHRVDKKLICGYVKHPTDGVRRGMDGVTTTRAMNLLPHDEVCGDLRKMLQHRWSLTGDDAARIALMGKWFGRGRDASEAQDKLLSFFICLEVFAARFKEKKKQPNAVASRVSRVLQEQLFPGLSADEVRDRLALGRASNLRDELVHHGHVGKDQWSSNFEFSHLVDRIEAVVMECMRIVLGLPYAGLLDSWIRRP